MIAALVQLTTSAVVLLSGTSSPALVDALRSIYIRAPLLKRIAERLELILRMLTLESLSAMHTADSGRRKMGWIEKVYQKSFS
jgi:hypothetical protein